MSVQALIADLLPDSPPVAKPASHVPPAKPANLAKNRMVAESAPVDKPAKPWLNMAKTPSAQPDANPVLATFSHASPDFSQGEKRAVTGGLANLAALAGDECTNDTHTEPETSIERLRRLHQETGRMIEREVIAANAEAIGSALESSLVEGAEALAKIRPIADPAPLATASYGEVVAWMDAAGETDPEVRRDILTGYGFDPDFQYLDSGRRTCRQCRNLDADGGCRAARRGQIPNTSRSYTWPAGIDAPHRCVGYLPGPDDADRRPGRERFDWPTAETQPDTGSETTAKAVCARCAHWTPDRINPPGGLGHCTIAAPASKRPGSLWPWPDAEIHCTRFQEITPC